MVKRENYPNAYKEVYVILNNMEEEVLKEIPKNVINKIMEKMNKEYEFKLDLNKKLKDQILLKETKIILGYLFLNYWSTQNQKEIIQKKFSNDIKKVEKSKGFYDGNLFKETNSEMKKEIYSKENKIIKYKREKIFKKFLRYLKKIFKKDKKY